MRTKSVEVRQPKWVWRVVVTVVLFLVMAVANQAYNAVAGGIEGELAVKQLSEDAQERAIGRAVAQADAPQLAWLIVGIVVVGVWGHYVYHFTRYNSAIPEHDSRADE